ncbi:hypothetical protein KC19_3G143500 [Ceratodon purpureus]|uniref:Pentatricopeptide repeat-containing protein n=1 Tax=Ceratodon purpureus TaxID=3225 RepID=A0A8T0IKV4_CERPU|nr:hypothetical protein KC19_3G143500 [Ceratodon purpureus]
MAVLSHSWAGAASVHHAQPWGSLNSVSRASCCCRGQRSATRGFRSSHGSLSGRIFCIQCVANHATRADDSSSRTQSQEHGFLVSKKIQDARDECISSDKALFSNDADVIRTNPAREESSNGAHCAELREEGAAMRQSGMPSVGPSASRRGGSDSTATFLQRKPSRRADVTQESTADDLAKPGAGSLPDSKAFELGNSRLVIKSNPAKATKQGESDSSNVRKTKATSEIVRKAVIDVLAHTDDMEEALQRAVASFGNRSTYWDQMMKELEVRGARRQALQVFLFLRKKPEFELKEHTCVTIISILGREGKLGLAREIFEGMTKDGLTPSAHSYTALLSGYAKQGLLKEAWNLFEVMKQKGCSPNVLTYNTLINACAKKGYRLSDLMGLYEEMKRNGVPPNDITYNCMVNACVCQKLFDKAALILKEMKAVNCLPNVVSYTAMINALGRSGRLDEAVELFEEMKELGRSPNSWTYNSLLKAYAREGRYEKAMGLFVGMEDEGCSPDLYTYNTVIDMCGRGGLFAEAEGVFLDMQRKGCTPDRVPRFSL